MFRSAKAAGENRPSLAVFLARIGVVIVETVSLLSESVDIVQGLAESVLDEVASLRVLVDKISQGVPSSNDKKTQA